MIVLLVFTLFIIDYHFIITKVVFLFRFSSTFTYKNLNSQIFNELPFLCNNVNKKIKNSIYHVKSLVTQNPEILKHSICTKFLPMEIVVEIFTVKEVIVKIKVCVKY